MTSFILNPFTGELDAVGQNGGSGSPAIGTTITTSTSITGSNINGTWFVDATAGNVVITLAVNKNNYYTFKKIDSTANTVTLLPASGTIDGGPNAVISTQYTSLTAQANGTNLYII